MIKEGIKIRGIYSTSLTKLLLDEGYEIANPSNRMKERLGIEGVPYAHTIIYDKNDKNGVVIHGEKDKEIVELLLKNFPYSSFRRIRSGDIYVGELQEILSDKKVIIVKLDENGLAGHLPISNYWGIVKKGEKVLVQVVDFCRGIPRLTTNLRIFGKNVIVIEKGFSKVSKHLTNKEEARRLLKIAEDYQIKGYGILWKALAENKPEELLRKEIESLINKLNELKMNYKDMNIGKILDGQDIYFIDFDYTAKRKLDNIRNKVVKTMDYHHMIRATYLSNLVDFAEGLLDYIDKSILIEKFREVLWNNILHGIIEIYHLKLNGKIIKLKGKIIEKDLKNRRVIIKRIVKGGKGKYDGLEIEKEKGDYIITEVVEGRWFILHEYYNKEGELKGKYYSINTPIEIYPKHIKYIDLEIDVVEFPDGTMKIIDEDQLEKVKGVYIKEDLYEKAKEIANFILRKQFEKCLEEKF